MAELQQAPRVIAEMREFAGFARAEQLYICRALDIGTTRCDAFDAWAGDMAAQISVRRQYLAYRDLPALRRRIADHAGDGVLPALIRLAAFDLAQGRIAGFSAFRFLYERLLGAAVRPLLPSAFCAAAALPRIAPERRADLLQSLSRSAATARGWSDAAPVFWPDWIAAADAA